MSDIFYSYGGNAYANLTNKCCCSCSFCVRNSANNPITSSNLWLIEEPSIEKALRALDEFEPQRYNELVFCGYGEPTYAFDTMIAVAEYARKRYNLKLRLNTNGLGNIINKKDIVPEIAKYTDAVSISLNASNSENYNRLCNPIFEGAYEEILDFAKKCHSLMADVTLTAVSVIGTEEIEKSKRVAEALGINFNVRDFIKGEDDVSY